MGLNSNKFFKSMTMAFPFSMMNDNCCPYLYQWNQYLYNDLSIICKISIISNDFTSDILSDWAADWKFWWKIGMLNATQHWLFKIDVQMHLYQKFHHMKRHCCSHCPNFRQNSRQENSKCQNVSLSIRVVLFIEILWS